MDAVVVLSFQIHYITNQLDAEEQDKVIIITQDGLKGGIFGVVD